MKPRPASLLTAIAVAAALSARAGAYVLNGPVWSTRSVAYSINTTNLDLPDADVETAVRTGADVWWKQTTGAFTFTYSGRSLQTATTNDGVNLVVFRDASSG